MENVAYVYVYIYNMYIHIDVFFIFIYVFLITISTISSILLPKYDIAAYNVGWLAGNIHNSIKNQYKTIFNIRQIVVFYWKDRI